MKLKRMCKHGLREENETEGGTNAEMTRKNQSSHRFPLLRVPKPFKNPHISFEPRRSFISSHITVHARSLSFIWYNKPPPKKIQLPEKRYRIQPKKPSKNLTCKRLRLMNFCFFVVRLLSCFNYLNWRVWRWMINNIVNVDLHKNRCFACMYYCSKWGLYCCFIDGSCWRYVLKFVLIQQKKENIKIRLSYRPKVDRSYPFLVQLIHIQSSEQINNKWYRKCQIMPDRHLVPRWVSRDIRPSPIKPPYLMNTPALIRLPTYLPNTYIIDRMNSLKHLTLSFILKLLPI